MKILIMALPVLVLSCGGPEKKNIANQRAVEGPRTTAFNLNRDIPAPKDIELDVTEKRSRETATEEKNVVKEISPDQLEIQLREIYFDSDSAEIKALDKLWLVEISEKINRLAEPFQVHIVGHTDPVGSEFYNWQLGLDRAIAVEQELLANNVDPLKISVKSVGESEAHIGVSKDLGAKFQRKVSFEVVPRFGLSRTSADLFINR